jgi:alkaline phosphatase
MLSSGVVDVLAGAGNPDFDDDGRPRSEPSYSYYGAADWLALKAGTRATHAGEPWTLVQDVEVIRSLATGQALANVVIVPRVGPTLQQMRARGGSSAEGEARREAFDTVPAEDPPTPGLPTLLDLARAGLNAVDDDPDGFFLMIEGGAVDWAMHDNQLGRAIEEYMEFDAAVRLISDYLDAGTNGHTWDNTLVIVTADHDHLLYGPAADKIPFQELEDRGKGKLPGYRWLFNSHSNSLVPLFARGTGSQALVELADEMDAFEGGGHRFGRGRYLHQAEVGKLLKQFMRGESPEAVSAPSP